ncbi:MAG: Ig-like domain-containing protein [Treponema sp.]|nr:Ig-like domain-containing protein [Treponema sp.]MCL2272365.1 Ig-like domain-containing protein [Treponema sp.]
MFRLLIYKLSVILLCAISVISCGFLDLRRIEYSIEPGLSGSVLDNAYSPVIIRFDTEMEKTAAERFLQISCDEGVIRGDLSWEENELYFIPLAGWTAGIRYTANLTGTIKSADGRELRLSQFVSFYAINKSEPPLLDRHYPALGESVGTGGIVLKFHFSRSMDRLTSESAFGFDVPGNKTFEWSDDEKTLNVIMENSLSPWTSCKWTIRNTAKSADGVPLPKTYSGYFTTDLDRTLPQVTEVYPVLFADGAWYPTGADIETGLAPDHGIAVAFNKPMGENVLRSLRFEPALIGKTESLSENSIVYIPAREPQPQTIYTLTVSADTKDSEGLKIGADYRISFVPDLPFLKVLSFSFQEDLAAENISFNSVLPVCAKSGTDELTFSTRFSAGFTTAEKINAVQRIYIAPFFPGTLPPAALQYVNWISDDCVLMRWEGISGGNEKSNHYYKLVIPGGRTGINNGMGMYMKEDLIVYMEAVNEN